MFQHKRTSILSSAGVGKAYFSTSTNPKFMLDFSCFAMYCEDYYKIYNPPIHVLLYGYLLDVGEGLNLCFFVEKPPITIMQYHR
jgi:hypothetical protein